MARPLIALALALTLAACSAPAPTPSPRAAGASPPAPTTLLSPTAPPVSTLPPTPTAAPTRPPAPTPTLVLHGNCILNAQLYAWHDLDRDGLPDPDEPPFPGVHIALSWFGAQRTTDAKGEAAYFSLVDCPAPDLVAVAEPPCGFAPTTPLRVSTTALVTGARVRFGFVQASP